MQEFPIDFVKQMEHLLKDESAIFFEALQTEPATSIRLNPFKKPLFNHSFTPVAWCTNAVYLKYRPSFVADPLFHAGTYYVQEASSMFLQTVFNQVKPKHTVKVLDLCAAPGGKSTLLLDCITDDDLLVANESIKKRVPILEENLLKWGRANVVVTNNDSQDFTKLTNFFDCIVVDAPCSGEGMFRKDKNAISEWSMAHTQFCAERQKRILENILPALKPGGFLIYSTCTFNTVENEENIAWLINKHAMQTVAINSFSGIEVVKKFEQTPLFAYRFYPHKVKGEGFFIACLQKRADDATNTIKNKTTPTKQKATIDVANWVSHSEQFVFTQHKDEIYAYPLNLNETINFLKTKLNIPTAGLHVGTKIKDSIHPSHALALSIYANKSVAYKDLNKEHALRYLRNETFALDADCLGICMVGYANFALGWVKIMPNRMNNYLPKNIRIIKDLPSLLSAETIG
ncbi:MAG: hypothetical protein H3C45_04775 [Bacteroidia bacterium]|nr:hypothetical protein [Bacteroidia bacterium]